MARKCDPRYAIVHAHDVAKLAILATSDKGVGQVCDVARPDVCTLKDFTVMAEAQQPQDHRDHAIHSRLSIAALG